MSKKIRLIYPIYLDVPMLVSFAAAIEGGLSFSSEVTTEKKKATNLEAEGKGKLALSALISRFVDVSAEGRVAANRNTEENDIVREFKSHTEASLAILLYDRLRKGDGYIIDPKNIEDLMGIEPGALVEVAGVVEKNAVDAVIDFFDASHIFSQIYSDEDFSVQGGKKSKRKPKPKMSPGLSIRDALDKDRNRTPFSNITLRCSIPEGLTAIVTLRRENLRDLTLSELHKNSVRVLGKVTRVVGKGEKVSAFENYGMALMPPEMLRKTFENISNNPNTVTDFSDIEVEGPAVQILPLMVFV